MTHTFNLAVVVLGFLSIIGVNGDDVNKFTYPMEEDLSLNKGDTIIAAYEGNISAPCLYTWCKDSAGNIELEQLDRVGGPNTTAPINLNFTRTDVVRCWFNIRLDETNSDVGANSVGFWYNSTEGDRKTFSSSSATSSTSSSSSPSSTESGVSTIPTAGSTSSTIPSPSPDSSAPTSPNPGLSTGAQAGTGVGAGVAGIAIGAAAVAFLYRRQRKRGADPSDNAPSASSHYPPTAGVPSMVSENPKPGYYPFNNICEAPNQNLCGAPIASRQEMDGTSTSRHEMP
ncbi:hypothetical protein F4804DRAFT_317646 [Jackrogersella minutella]|nr:hypothetical protein F4804DRAFT_317646 [Jackrogersella minutella]